MTHIRGFPEYESSYILLDGFSVLRTLFDSNFMVYESHDLSVLYNAKVTFDFHTGEDSSWGTMPLFLENNAHLFVPFELDRMKRALESKLHDMPHGLTKEERRQIILDITKLTMWSKLIIVPYMAQIWRDEIKLNYFRRIGHQFIAHVTATNEWFANNKENGYIVRELDYSHIVKGKINPDKLVKAISKWELCTLIYEFNDVYIFFVNLNTDTDLFLFSCEFPEFTISKLTDYD